MHKVEVLDCTFRDGGHHNNWDFSLGLANKYFDAIAKSGISWSEIGYRRPNTTKFQTQGPWAFCHEDLLEQVIFPESLNLAVMVDLKDYIDLNIKDFFIPKEQSHISMVRIASHFHHLEYLSKIVAELRDLGYQVAVNLMRSAQVNLQIIQESLRLLNNLDIQIINFADSYGSFNPTQVQELLECSSKISSKPLGFHAHDNKQLALQNSLKAISYGAQWIDSTLAGMGKGPGNTATEFLLIELSKHMNSKQYAPENLSSILQEDFYPLKKQLGWGSDLYSYLAADRNIHPDQIQQLKETL